MAPEVFRGKKYDQKCDIFSVGVLLWEIIARRYNGSKRLLARIYVFRVPFAGTEFGHANIFLFQVAQVGLRPPRISNCPTPIMDVIERYARSNYAL